jgi:hypothetical protein
LARSGSLWWAARSASIQRWIELACQVEVLDVVVEPGADQAEENRPAGEALQGALADPPGQQMGACAEVIGDREGHHVEDPVPVDGQRAMLKATGLTPMLMVASMVGHDATWAWRRAGP